MNIKKYIIRIFQLIVIAICCFLFAVISGIFSGNFLVAFLQIAVFSVVVLRLKSKQNFKIWHYIIWFALFPCYFIYGDQSEYGNSWHSQIKDIYILGIANSFSSFATLFYGRGGSDFFIEKFIKEHNSLILYQVYSLLFFFFSTILFLVKKHKIGIPKNFLNKKSIFLLLFLLFSSLGYHFFSSEIDKSFRYTGNVKLWNYSLYYIILYFILFTLFISFKNRIFNFSKSLFIILITLIITFFPVISVSSVIIESYFIDDGKFRAAREVIFSPLFHALTTTLVTTFEDLSINFAYINIHSIRMYTIFQILWSLFFILPLLTPKIKLNG